ncbi:VOC family protein [Alkalibacterium pelagium]|uniref:Catechol 2,3-dioxygenase n=1 Tax=Alkalibacterium pelagium TaxID=426702 RepID=A0A1H7FAH3_9LACT|nr:VOC family protein [Alkalibacterium pelagium]GEN49416.1 hypothetical protein APE02nite_00810 [Alkalibacterium pelagium]SEK23163.1 Catechol 2,3-dioxygenase [Alkalibacterium pelagium]
MTTLGFTYIYTDNIKEMKKFYTSLLGLDLIWDETDSIAFKIGSHQFSIIYHESFEIPSAHFAMQPGWEGGTYPRTSWSLDYDSTNFIKVIRQLSANGVRSYYAAPQWNGYWSYPVLDPMNNTIEVTCTDADYIEQHK